MASPNTNGKITVSQVLFPLSLVAFVLFIMLAFQTSQILREREALHDAHNRQDKPVEETQKVQAQISALAQGTKKLADAGDKNAQAIIDRLKQMGIVVGSPAGASGAAPSAAAPTVAPAAPAAPAPAAKPKASEDSTD